MKNTGLWFRRLLLLLFFLAFAGLVVSRFANLRQVFTTMLQGKWQWVGLAVLIHATYYVLYALLYESGFNVVGVKTRTSDLLPLVFASIFVNVVAPAGGAGGAALYVDYAVREHQSGARAAVGTLLVLVSDFATVIPFIIPAGALLYERHKLQAYQVIAAAVFVFFVAALTFALFLARWRPSLLTRLMRGIESLVNRIGSWFRHPNLLRADWGKKNAAELCEGAEAIVENKRDLARTLGIGLVLHSVNLAGLAALFLAYNQPLNIGTLLAGFSLATIFWVVAIVPAGVGAVEAVLTLALTSLGMPNVSAVAVTLAYRGLNFWLPLILGLLLLPRLKILAGALGSHSQPEEA